MVVLGIETATDTLSVALVDGERLLAEAALYGKHRHSELTLPIISQLVDWLNLSRSELSGIAVSSGPGSFTGLRIGVNVAKGIAYALKVPVIGVCTLQALAFRVRFRASLIWAVLDAKGGEFYRGVFRSDLQDRVELVGNVHTVSYEIFKAELEAVSGHVMITGDIMEVRRLLGSSAKWLPNVEFAPLEIAKASAASVAMIGAAMIRKGMSDDVFRIVPQYVRRASAETRLREKSEVEAKSRFVRPGDA